MVGKLNTTMGSFFALKYVTASRYSHFLIFVWCAFDPNRIMFCYFFNCL